MKDIRELQVLDNSFELSETIGQNEELTISNRQLMYIGLALTSLLVGTILFIINNKPTEDSAKKND